MDDATPVDERPIGIAIMAMGGQGGGVLADWILSLARGQGWVAQGTSVPGVAQRTGSTVYYVELARREGERLPIMAQMPVPGDVDVVIASEMMEIGRALLRGFCTPDRTVLIGSTHRIYAISEKAAMGDGRGDSQTVLTAAEQGAKRLVAFDMDAATQRSGSVISSVMFGALAGSDVLPFPVAAFEDAIRASGIAVAGNLAGFAAGREAARGGVALPQPAAEVALPQPTTAAGRLRLARIEAELPEPAMVNARHGVQRLMDYQDAAYADLYLARLARVAALDRAPFELTAETARHLALWMSFDDIIRVADLKIRASRLVRVEGEVQKGRAQLLGVSEFMHPRLHEICDILPAPLGRAIRRNERLSALLGRAFRRGRQVETTSLVWFLLLRSLARLRRWRPRSLRYGEEQARIEQWLALVRRAAPLDNEMAIALVRCQRLLKGYGDTWERGWNNFAKIMAASVTLPADAAGVRRLQSWS